MGPLHAGALGAIAVLGLLLAAGSETRGWPSVQQESKAPPITASERARLTALKPDRPEAYVMLAEDIADGADDEARIGLARTLFILAFELDRKAGGGSTLSAASALAVARLERLDRDRRWLTAIAGAADRRYALPDWNVGASPSISDETAYKAATVLGLTRSGDGREARRMFDQPGVANVLRHYERAIGSTGETGALSRLDKYMQQWPCPECGNARTVSRPGEKGPEVRLCPTCRGNPGPHLSEEESIAQLRFEAALLNGIQRSWAAQIVVDQGAPLRDPDLEELAPTYGVDPARSYWRDGGWVASP
jgi:hypothetical protein